MLKDTVRERQEEQNRRSEMNAAVGLCKMSGANPSEAFYTLMEDYISGDRTLDEINADIDRRYKEKVLGFTNGGR